MYSHCPWPKIRCNLPFEEKLATPSTTTSSCASKSITRAEPAPVRRTRHFSIGFRKTGAAFFFDSFGRFALGFLA